MPSSKCIRAERKRQIEKGSERSRKDFFVNALPTTLTTTKAMPTKITTVTTRAVVMAVFGTIKQMVYIVVPNQYRKKVTGHNHRLILISF